MQRAIQRTIENSIEEFAATLDEMLMRAPEGELLGYFGHGFWHSRPVMFRALCPEGELLGYFGHGFWHSRLRAPEGELLGYFGHGFWHSRPVMFRALWSTEPRYSPARVVRMPVQP